MIDIAEIRPDDRVLLLSIADVSVLRAIAGKLARGLLVGIGPDAAVRDARRLTADCDNVMFVPEAEDGSIPWQDAFFTIVVAPEESREARRVLAPGGRYFSLSL